MAYQFPRCQVVPLPGDQASFQIDDRERLRWHFGGSHPRPFFYPLLGPSGQSLTRMGHPGAPNHDHHRSIWFAHHKVLGIDFWSDRTEARIRQKHWLAYRDGNDEALMAVALDWHDGHDPEPLLEQQLIASVSPADEGETLLELQSSFRPHADTLEFGQTNFGFLAVRVAKHLSAHFGGGQLTNSERARGEPAIFGKRARWMDYSGPAPAADPNEQAHEGITYFDHPSNPGFPSHWHVREDGWMGASPSMKGPLATQQAKPLVLRYLLHAHAGDIQPGRADKLAAQFAARAPLVVERAEVKHQQFAIRRAT